MFCLHGSSWKKSTLNGSGCGKFSYDLLPEGELYLYQLNVVIADGVGLHRCLVKLFLFLVIQTPVSISALLGDC